LGEGGVRGGGQAAQGGVRVAARLLVLAIERERADTHTTSHKKGTPPNPLTV
jgi:hypothetical protein